MNPFLNHSLEALHDRAKVFAQAEIAPLAAHDETDCDKSFVHYLGLLAREGLLAHAVVAPEAEASTLSLREVCLLREALAYQSPLAELAFVMQGLGTYPVAKAGSAALKQRILSAARAGTCIAAFALTEPEAGSDVASLRTRAVRTEGGYLLSGEKWMISNVPLAHGFSLFASTDPSAKAKGISAFWVDANASGVSCEATELSAAHPIGRIRLDNVFVPEESRLGDEGKGMALALQTLDFFRSSVGAAALGMARRAMQESISFVKQRIQFGKPLAEQPLVQEKLAKMVLEIEAGWLLVLKAAYTKDGGAARITQEAAMAKLYATEAAFRVIDDAVQLHGARGLIKNSIPERLYRDIRAMRIYEGTSEIQHLVIASGLLRE